MKITVNKTQEFLINVKVLLDALVKWAQGVKDRVSSD